MHLMYTLDSEGKRTYTLKKVLNGEVTKSAHPARFSPDDKYSRFVDPFLLSDSFDFPPEDLYMSLFSRYSFANRPFSTNLQAPSYPEEEIWTSPDTAEKYVVLFLLFQSLRN